METGRRGFLGLLGIGAVVSQLPPPKAIAAPRVVVPAVGAFNNNLFSPQRYLAQVAEMLLDDWHPMEGAAPPKPTRTRWVQFAAAGRRYETPAAEMLIAAIRRERWNYMTPIKPLGDGVPTTELCIKKHKIALTLREECDVDDGHCYRLWARGGRA